MLYGVKDTFQHLKIWAEQASFYLSGFDFVHGFIVREKFSPFWLHSLSRKNVHKSLQRDCIFQSKSIKKKNPTYIVYSLYISRNGKIFFIFWYIHTGVDKEEINEVNQRLKYKFFPNFYETTVFDITCTAGHCKAVCLACLKQSDLMVGDKNFSSKCPGTRWDRISCLVHLLICKGQT